MTACLCSTCRARRKEYTVGGDGIHEPEKKSSLKAELTISNQYSESNFKQLSRPEDHEKFCSVEITFTGFSLKLFIESFVLILDILIIVVILHSRSPNERTQTYSSDVRTDERADWQNADSKQ